MKRMILCMLLPACGLGLDSTIADEEALLGLDAASEGLNDEDLEPLALDGVYEAASGFVIDVDAIDGNNGSVFASDICEGNLTIEIDLRQAPPVFGKGDCTLQTWGIDGRGEITGEVDEYTGEITGSIYLTLDTEPVSVHWTGWADGEQIVGDFEGSLPFSSNDYELDLDYLGEFQAQR